MPSHYLNQCCIIVNWTIRNQRQSNDIENSKIFFQENAFENVVWERRAILSRLECVKIELVSIFYICWGLFPGILVKHWQVSRSWCYTLGLLPREISLKDLEWLWHLIQDLTEFVNDPIYELPHFQFMQNTHDRQFVAHLWGQGMGWFYCEFKIWLVTFLHVFCQILLDLVYTKVMHLIKIIVSRV